MQDIYSFRSIIDQDQLACEKPADQVPQCLWLHASSQLNKICEEFSAGK